MTCWKCGTDDCDDCGVCQLCGKEMDLSHADDDICNECMAETKEANQ